MSFSFPEFREPNWAATFDSYDQRNDDVYYVVTICEGAYEGAEFMAQVSLCWAGDDWSGQVFSERLKHELHILASTGRTNTTYGGPMV